MSDLVRRLRRSDPRIFDWLLAIAFTASAIASAYTTEDLVGPAWLTALVAASGGSRPSSAGAARSPRTSCGRSAS